MDTSVKQVTVLGATGQVGQVVLQEALEAGYEVRVLARSPHKLGVLRESVEVIEGDLLDASAVGRALHGSQAVLSAAGGVKEPDQAARFRQIGRNLSGAMKEQGVTRLVNISGAVVLLPGERLDLQRRLMRVMVNLFFRQMLQAQDAFTPIITNDPHIDWTLVRAAVISTGPGSGSVLADDQKLPALKIALDDLGRFMVEQVESTEWIRRAPLVASAKR